MKPFLALSLLLIISASFATARAVRDWPYEELMEKSDLVVIADPLSTTPTSDLLQDEGGDPKSSQGLDTKFRVMVRFKGEHPQEDFTVLHFRYAPSVSEVNGAQFVHFRLHELSFSGTLEGRSKDKKTPEKVAAGSFGMGKPSYLLFLKKRSDGRYEPVADQYDAELSCREVTRTMPAMFFQQH